MYSVSQKYKEAIAQTGQTYRVTGTVGDVSFDDAAVMFDSLCITNQASASTDVNLGGVFVGQLEMVFLPNSINIPRGSWTGKLVKIKIGLQLSDGTFEDVPFQPFTITEANWSDNGIEIKAVDYMVKFDKTSTFNTTSGTPEQLLKYLCGRAGVNLGMTSAQIQALPNGTEILGIDPDSQSKLKTYRDILGWLAQALGTFATIDRSGALVLRTFTGTNDGNVGADVRYTGGKYSDWLTRYTGMSVVNTKDNTTTYYNVTPDDGLTMNLGANPFLQLGLPEVVKDIRERILNQISKIRFTPFDIDTVPNPAIDLGDILTFPDGLGAGVTGCVMAIELKYKNSLTIEGFGKNPSLASAQSKSDKELSGLETNQKTNVVKYFMYENVEAINLNQSEQIITSIKFGNSQETDVDIWSEFKINAIVTEPTQRVYAYYYLDGQLQFYQPIETWSETGFHILGLHYHILNLEPNSLHIFEVRLKTEGGTGTINIGDAHVVLSGIALATSEEWDGLIELRESVGLYYAGNYQIALAEQADVELQIPIPAEFNETIDLYYAGNYSAQFVEDVQIVGRFDLSNRITEDGLFERVTEDGESIRVTEYKEDETWQIRRE